MTRSGLFRAAAALGLAPLAKHLPQRPEVVPRIRFRGLTFDRMPSSTKLQDDIHARAAMYRAQHLANGSHYQPTNIRIQPMPPTDAA